MTAEEVKKSLEVCGNGKYCRGCVFYQGHIATCTAQLAVEALNLITEQEEKIEELSDKHWSECRQIMHYDNELNGKEQP